MPSAELMTWNPAQKRWFKQYRGKMYAVSPKKLGCEATKDASRQRANDSWIAKQKDIDAQLGKAKNHPVEVQRAYEEAIERHRLFAKWLRLHGQGVEDNWLERATKAEARVEWLTAALQSDNPPCLTPEESSPFQPFTFLPNSAKWADRLATMSIEEKQEQAVPHENTIRGHIDQYLALKKAQCLAKGKIVSYSSVKQWLEVFRQWLDPHLPLAQLDAQLWERYFIYLSNRVANNELSPASAKDYIGAARSFIRNRFEMEFIDKPPRNLTSKQYAISVPIKEPLVFTIPDVQAYLRAAQERTRLYILLMLNLGAYPQDITYLQQNEVDWERGRVFRKRTKTRDRSEAVPKVDYPLWNTTFTLLKTYRSNHPELALLNEDGKCLLTERESKNGKLSRNQNIQFAYRRLQEKMKVEGEAKKGLKAFRKTAATLLEQSPFRRFAEHYLGEAPQTITSKHYAHQNGAEFDSAILWLGKTLGIE